VGEQPVLGLKALGIAAVVAGSFARIFYRSSINQGLLLIECLEAVNAYKEGDVVSLDLEKGMITVGSKTLSFPRLPKEILAIRDAGGLLPYTREKLKQRKKR
jgi:3-isopropylmalate dehydratase small subunit